MTDEPPDPNDTDDENIGKHLENVEDGVGCTEIWEHLSENRGTDAACQD